MHRRKRNENETNIVKHGAKETTIHKYFQPIRIYGCRFSILFHFIFLVGCRIFAAVASVVVLSWLVYPPNKVHTFDYVFLLRLIFSASFFVYCLCLFCIYLVPTTTYSLFQSDSHCCNKTFIQFSWQYNKVDDHRAKETRKFALFLFSFYLICLAIAAATHTSYLWSSLARNIL